MQIIEMLETLPRKIYTGSIGYLAPGRKMSFNVAIRTALFDRRNNTGEYGVGGGIVWDSNTADEYDESQHKARILAEPSIDFLLYETIIWIPNDGYFLLDYHLERLVASAHYFGFKVDRAEVCTYLTTIATAFSSSPQRVKIEVDRTGDIAHHTTAAPDTSTSKIRLKLSRIAVNSADRMLFHKTSCRDIYKNACRTVPDADDALLWNERNEITETSIANVVMDINKRLVTPALCSGLLPGVMRRHLLESKTIIEGTVRIDDILKARKIYRINSVRKWEPCVLID